MASHATVLCLCCVWCISPVGLYRCHRKGFSHVRNVALPSIAQTLRTNASDIVWVVSSYQLAVLVALLPCGALGEKFGPRRVFLAGVALFTLASAACALANSLPMLVCARFVQGLGGGAIMALAMMILRFAVPQAMLGTIIGINAMTIAISSAAGPGLAGAILSVAPWPWLFAVNLPIGVLVLLGGGLLPHPKGSARRLDAAAVVVNSLMFVLFFSGADRLAKAPAMGAGLIAAAAVCLVVLLRIERRSATPLVPVDLFGDRAFSVAVIASVCCFTGQMMSYVALPFYLQHTLHMTPAGAGLYMMPWPAAVIVMAPLSGRLANRIPTAWLCAAGGALLATGLAVVALSPPDGLVFVAGTTVAGAGFGLFQTPNNRILLLSAPKARSGAAGAMQGTARLTGQTFGAISASILFGLVPLESAAGLALGIAAVAAAVAGTVSASRARFETAAA
ncbi:MAG: MFS transporter [Asticcacaulis sp.]|nr:MFS transporter [Asticcacaulis sp.]